VDGAARNGEKNQVLAERGGREPRFFPAAIPASLIEPGSRVNPRCRLRSAAIGILACGAARGNGAAACMQGLRPFHRRGFVPPKARLLPQRHQSQPHGLLGASASGAVCGGDEFGMQIWCTRQNVVNDVGNARVVIGPFVDAVERTLPASVVRNGEKPPKNGKHLGIKLNALWLIGCSVDRTRSPTTCSRRC
jgi:hypothetical protein